MKQEAVKLLQLLDQFGEEGRLVGGCVRDEHLGLTPNDYDIAATPEPEQTAAIMRQAGYKVIPTGLDHGTISVLTPLGIIQVTTLRRDVSTDGRHAQVSFSRDFAVDAARRDFTINALYEDQHGKIYDFFGGLTHLREKKLVFVGDAAQRIREDYLRILRFFRFQARFGFEADPEALDAIVASKDGLVQLSRERVQHEIWGFLDCEKVSTGLVAMTELGVMPLILSRVNWVELNHLPALWDEHASIPSQRPEIRLALALLLSGIVTREGIADVCHSLRCSKRQRDYMSVLICGYGDFMASLDSWDKIGQLPDLFMHHLEPAWRLWLRCQVKVGPYHATNLARLREIEEHFGHIRRAKLPLATKELTSRFCLHGKDIGVILSQLTRSYRNGVWKTEEEAYRLVETEILPPVATSTMVDN